MTPDTPIERLCLPTRAYRALLKVNAVTVGQVLALRSRLTNVRGIGTKTAEEIEGILASLPSA
jgi:DNA-directed RNA polymerase alpha subunit